MNPETTRVPENAIASLTSCLIEGDPLQQRRARNIRRRAIFFSVVFQSITVTALIILPLLGKGEHLSTRIIVPLPPFRLSSPQHVGDTAVKPTNPHPSDPFFFSKTHITFGKPSVHDGRFTSAIGDDIPGIGNQPIGTRDGVLNGSESTTPTPARPQNDPVVLEAHQRVTIAHIDPARLTSRVEPSYPHLGVQLRRETRVELQAVIATDGSITSLQVVSGDPLFYQSALDAVRHWRYTPTLLNGQPVEVDTQITVIYTLTR